MPQGVQLLFLIKWPINTSVFSLQPLFVFRILNDRPEVYYLIWYLLCRGNFQYPSQTPSFDFHVLIRSIRLKNCPWHYAILQYIIVQKIYTKRFINALPRYLRFTHLWEIYIFFSILNGRFILYNILLFIYLEPRSIHHALFYFLRVIVTDIKLNQKSEKNMNEWSIKRKKIHIDIHGWITSKC